MKLTYVGHASALIEHNGKRLLFDPWLDGSVYWGSWWHFPEPAASADLFEVDYIYLSHWHFDHMHAETLAKFSRDVRLILPKFPVSGLPEPLRSMGFRNITELGNGGSFDLANGFRLTSYQVQLQDDSAAVVTCTEADGRETTIVNLNDAKPLPSTWRRLRRRHPRIDFMLRSHSPAWSYPTAFEFENPADAIAVDGETYKEAFRAAAEQLAPRYAIPFASGVCHLTADTLFENANLILARDLLAYFAEKPLAGTELRYMAPGSTWEAGEGFSASAAPPDQAALSTFVARALVDRAPELARIEREIDARVLKTEVFDKYFRELRARSLPLWWLVDACWRFDISSSRGTRTLSFDFRRSRTTLGDPGRPVTATFRVAEGILAEALETMTFSNIDVAKRWKVRLARGQVTKYFLIGTFSGLNEAGYLRLGNLWNARLWWGLLRRRDELWDYAKMALAMVLRGKDAALETTVKKPVRQAS